MTVIKHDLGLVHGWAAFIVQQVLSGEKQIEIEVAVDIYQIDPFDSIMYRGQGNCPRTVKISSLVIEQEFGGAFRPGNSYEDQINGPIPVQIPHRDGTDLHIQIPVQTTFPIQGKLAFIAVDKNMELGFSAPVPGNRDQVIAIVLVDSSKQGRTEPIRNLQGMLAGEVQIMLGLWVWPQQGFGETTVGQQSKGQEGQEERTEQQAAGQRGNDCPPYHHEGTACRGTSRVLPGFF